MEIRKVKENRSSWVEKNFTNLNFFLPFPSEKAHSLFVMRTPTKSEIAVATLFLERAIQKPFAPALPLLSEILLGLLEKAGVENPSFLLSQLSREESEGEFEFSEEVEEAFCEFEELQKLPFSALPHILALLKKG